MRQKPSGPGRTLFVQLDEPQLAELEAAYASMAERAAESGHRPLGRLAWYPRLLMAGLRAEQAIAEEA